MLMVRHTSNRQSNELTRIKRLFIIPNAGEFDINKVNLELLLSLDPNEQRRTTASSDNFVGEVDGLEDKGEGALLKWG